MLKPPGLIWIALEGKFVMVSLKPVATYGTCDRRLSKTMICLLR